MRSISEINDQKLMSMSQDLHDARKELRAITKQLNQYKSIVKEVDPDNLPDGDQLHFWSPEIEAIVRGRFDSDGDFEEHDQTIHDSTFVTHYIEQKDLIKLFEDSK